jgi:hypothetical protein
MRVPHRRVPATAGIALLTSLAMALPTALLESGTVTAAHSAAPTGDCAQPYPIASVTSGQVVNGMTVTKGVGPTPFTGEVLGVLKDGVLPGVDLVMARLDSTEIQRVGGIWQGMSGSPVYAQDGRLIGAVAYGFASGPSPVAGITPFAQMQTSLNRTLPEKVRVGDRVARRLAQATGVSKASARQGFEQLPTPLAVAGVPASLLTRKRTRPYLPRTAYAAGASPAGLAPTETDMVAGGNLGVTFSTGDITQGAFGTITSVCNGLVRGFGHPFNLLGKTTYAMTGAETLYIQDDPVMPPFTVANFGTPLGTITQDRIVGVSGPLGPLPAGAAVSNTVTYGANSRPSTSTVTVKDAMALTTNLAMVVNHLRVLDSFPPGSEVQTWTITGKDGTTPFTLQGGNRYADTYDVTGISQWDLPDLVWALGFVPDLTIDSVISTSNVTDDPAPYRLVGVEQRANGQWIRLNKETPAHAKAGKKLRLRLLLANDAGNTTVPLRFGIPFKAAGQRGKLFLDQAIPFPFEQGELPTTLAGMRKLLHNMVRNDQVQGQLSFFSEFGSIDRSKKTAPAGRVITGSRRVKVIVD